MKPYLFFLNFLFVFGFFVMVKAEGKRQISDKSRCKQESNIIDLVQIIINDPGFLSLCKEQKLRILQAIHNMLQNLFRKTKTESLVQNQNLTSSRYKKF